ncbi:cytochrome ubiquinol oxidase subunit I [Weizmannia acidilactici]|jgi:cytochrome d ubiquinol oxidase subunit I|uniref:Cytochrome ubiquinol oxidase subunit I n=1 Tax=Weizmannia acidilactici TaxID=2607726 RepID=A0A5J4JLH2_9BACI|nr:cytochrome ubiquinol oxidase subunit I [Weizmannia acidilactici]GER67212.1 cytochrome ubiquinol oxidase subunit I [Weizmannia acidilactici]GER69854.1 cytochrome ubiquinol oxidase subunit I [Weizmannia acidilactici]GER73367.1 cytochrome ubiquinol oxidase subunit I [Weizmannia acidilactici]
MSELVLARAQFATTTLFHFIFVPLSIGLAFIVAVMQTLYLVKKKEIYRKMAKFWGTFFLINFAVGVVTGIIQEFQFGMNWSSYSRFVGDVFGAPLAIEALLAFFMESTFIGLWIFGWDRLPKKLHLACIWLVSIGTMLSALWIMAANSFMQNPAGYTIHNGRAEMNDFAAVILNQKLQVAYPHIIFGSLATGAFFIAGVSAWNLIKKKEVAFFKRSVSIALIIGLIGGIGLAFSGHDQARYLVRVQPMKMAAAEGLWNNSGDPAPWTLFAVIDTKNKKSVDKVEIPYLLSYLSYGKFSGEVKGMNTLQKEYVQEYGEGNYIPPVKTTFWSFRIMVVVGGILILFSLIGLYLVWKKKIENSTRFLKWLFPVMFLPTIGNSFGWIMSEMGRQPWVVNGLMKTSAGVSPNVSAGEILFSIIAFSLVYTLLAVAMAYLFIRVIKQGPQAKPMEDITATDPFNTRRVG